MQKICCKFPAATGTSRTAAPIGPAVGQTSARASAGPSVARPGSFRAYTFWTLSEALSRLYQRRFLRPRPHFSAFFKLYIFFLFFFGSFTPFQISVIFQAFAPPFCKICRFFADFQRRQQILQIFTEFQRNFAGISQNFNNLAKSDAKIATFQRNLGKLQKICRQFPANLSQKMYA